VRSAHNVGVDDQCHHARGIFGILPQLLPNGYLRAPVGRRAPNHRRTITRLNEQVRRFPGFGEARSQPTAWATAGVLSDHLGGAGNISGLVFHLLHILLRKTMPHEFPVAIARGPSNRLIGSNGTRVAESWNSSNTSRRRQNPTRLPYSCQAQLGTSGMGEPPAGGEMANRPDDRWAALARHGLYLNLGRAGRRTRRLAVIQRREVGT
jgi:hypothetical protein